MKPDDFEHLVLSLHDKKASPQLVDFKRVDVGDLQHPWAQPGLHESFFPHSDCWTYKKTPWQLVPRGAVMGCGSVYAFVATDTLGPIARSDVIYVGRMGRVLPWGRVYSHVGKAVQGPSGLIQFPHHTWGVVQGRDPIAANEAKRLVISGAFFVVIMLNVTGWGTTFPPNSPKPHEQISRDLEAWVLSEGATHRDRGRMPALNSHTEPLNRNVVGRLTVPWGQ